MGTFLILLCGFITLICFLSAFSNDPDENYFGNKEQQSESLGLGILFLIPTVIGIVVKWVL